MMKNIHIFNANGNKIRYELKFYGSNEKNDLMEHVLMFLSNATLVSDSN